MVDIRPIQKFLRCETPDAWLQNALAQQELLLIDHANCEQVTALEQCKKDRCFAA